MSGLHLRHGGLRIVDSLEAIDRAPANPARRRIGRLISVAGCLMVLVPAAPALAGIGEGNSEIGFDYAIQRLDSGLEVGSGGRPSFRAGQHLTGSLQWEGQVTRISVEEEPLPGAARKVTLSFALANLVYNFHPRRGVVPYVLAGAGLAKTNLEAVGLSSGDTQTAYQIAGGSRFFFGERSAAALRIELSILGNDAFEHSYFHYSIGAGLTFRLGREPV